MAYAVTDESGRFIIWSYDEIEGGSEFSNPETVEESFRGEVSDFKLVGGVAVFEPTPERQQEISNEEEARTREARLSAILASYSDTLIPSDKVGQLFKVVKLGEVEILREYVPDPNYTDDADGSYLKPFTFTPGMEVTESMWYTDGSDIWECVQGGIADAFTAPWFDVIA